MKVLQTFALPLGDRALMNRRNKTIIAKGAAAFLADVAAATQVARGKDPFDSVLTDCFDRSPGKSAWATN